MKLAVFLCALLLGIGSAAAQNIGPNNAGPGGGIAPGKQAGGSGCPLTGCTYTGPVVSAGITDGTGITANAGITTVGVTDSGGINTTATTGYALNGTTVLNVINPLNANPVIAIGAGACAAMTSTANFNMCIGNGALATYTGSASAELIMVGPKAGAFLVSPAVHDVGLGTYAMHYETTGQSDTCMGGDCMRNSIGVIDGTELGSFAGGGYYGQLSTGVGAGAHVGNSASVTISGTVTTSDVIQLTFTSTLISGGATTVSYTVAGGNTTANIASGLATAMTANSALINADIRSLYDGTATPSTMVATGPGTSVLGTTITVTNTSSGSPTETVTITGGVAATATRNNAVGFDAEYFSRLTTASNNNCMGAFCLASLSTGNQNDLIGDSAGQNGTTATQVAAIGDEAFLGITTGFANSGVGWRVGLACTTCRNVSLFGKGAGTSTLQTGNDIILISDGSACDTNTSNTMQVCMAGGSILTAVNTNNAAMLLKTLGPVQVAGTTFTISGCSTTTLVGGASRGSFLSGTAGTCTPVITMGGATGVFGVTNGWACYAFDVTTPTDIITETTSNATTATLSGTTASGDKIVFSCEPY